MDKNKTGIGDTPGIYASSASLEITFNDYPVMEQAQFLLEFIKVCSNGSIRPYDHSYFLRKLQNSGLHQNEINSLSQCCPPDSEIRDALEFKPYMLAALDKLASIIGLPVSQAVKFTKQNDFG